LDGALKCARHFRDQIGKALLDLGRRGACGIGGGPDDDRILGFDGDVPGAGAYFRAR
jgi:hypothetical protein